MTDMMRFFTTEARKPVDCDCEKGILRNCCLATTGIASDGWIILPEGIDLAQYLKTPIVTARHIAQMGDATVIQENTKPAVIANVLNLKAGAMELIGEIQFARTGDGYDYGYLYGLNPDKQPFMRSWSVEGAVLERKSVNWKQAEALSRPYFDPILAERLRAKITQVQVATRFELRVVAAVPLGADRSALTRAAQSGMRVAGEILARMDLDAASSELVEMKKKLEETDSRLVRLESEIQALRAEGASAGARRDSEAVLAEVRRLRDVLRKN